MAHNDAFEYYRDIGDGRDIWVMPRIYNAIIGIGLVDDRFGYDTHWCYQTVELAIAAATAWDPLTQKEPDGWFRHAATGRRRPDGDASKEYVAL